MASSGMNSETAAIIDLLQRARHAHRDDPTTAPGLLLAAVNKAVKAVDPNAEPKDTVRRLSAKWDKWALEAGYTALEWYHEDSKNENAFSVYGEDEWDDHRDIAEDIIVMLAKNDG